MRCFPVFIMLILMSCSSHKVDQQIDTTQLPSDSQAYYEEWVGGAPGSGMGSMLYVPVAMLDSGEPVEVYFNGNRSARIEYFGMDTQMIRVRLAAMPSRDLIMDADVVRESSNQIESTHLPSRWQMVRR